MRFLIYFTLLFAFVFQYKTAVACSPPITYFQVLSPYDALRTANEPLLVPQNAIFVLEMPESGYFGYEGPPNFTAYINDEIREYEVLYEFHEDTAPVSYQFYQVIQFRDTLMTGDTIYFISSSNAKTPEYTVSEMLAEDETLTDVSEWIELQTTDIENPDGQSSACDPVDGYFAYRNMDLVFTFPMEIYPKISFIDYGFGLQETKNIKGEYVKFKYLDLNNREVANPDQAAKVSFVLNQSIVIGTDPNQLIKDYLNPENDQYRCAKTKLILKDGDVIEYQSCISKEEISAMEQMLYADRIPTTQDTDPTGESTGEPTNTDTEMNVDASSIPSTSTEEESGCQMTSGPQHLFYLLVIFTFMFLHRKKLN